MMPPRHNRRVNLPLNERIKDGRIFEISKRTIAGVIYMRCTTRFCFGTAKKIPNGDIIIQREHSAICYSDRNAQTKADFIQALKAALERNFWKLKEVYETVVAMYPRNIKVLLPFNSILSSMKRWRRSFYPPCPKTIEEMAMQLEDPQNERLLEYDVGRLVSRRIVDSDGNLHLMIYDPQFIRNEFASVSNLFIDGTFKTTPRVRGIYQLVSVLGIKYDHALPFAHILMANKTQVAYTAVLTKLSTLISTASVTVVMTDFEQALRNACRAIFQNSYIAGCNVHYDRALLKKIKALRLTPLITESEVAKGFLRRVMALAYLPEQVIQAEFTRLKNALPPGIKRSLAGFLRYYTRQWLGIVKPSGFSVFGLSRRTNNVIESYNSVLAAKLGEHPSAWTFMAKLTKLTSDARDDIKSLTLNKRIKRHPRYASIYKHKELTNAWKQLVSGRINTGQFLEKAVSLKGHISQRLLNIPDERLDDLVEMVETPDNIRFEADPDYDRELFEDEHLEDFAHADADAPVQVHNQESDSDDTESQRSSITNGAEHDRSMDDMLDVVIAEDEEVNAANSDSDDMFDIRNEEADAENIIGDDNIVIEQNEEADAENIIGYDNMVIEQNEEADLELGDLRPETERAAIEVDASNGDSLMEPDESVLVEIITANDSDTGDVAQAANNEVGTARAPERTAKVSASRKKNLRKKRSRKLKALSQDGLSVRPYGHKRRNTKRDKKVPKCVVCRMNTVSHGFVPCGHNCSCLRCATILMENRPKRCPKCRGDFTQCIAIFNE